MVIRIAALIASASFVLLVSTASAGLQEMADRFARMGRDAINNKDWVECIEDFEQVLEIDEENLDAYLDLAYCQTEMKQWQDAADTYAAALEYAPAGPNEDFFGLFGYLGPVTYGAGGCDQGGGCGGGAGCSAGAMSASLLWLAPAALFIRRRRRQ